MLGVVSSLDFSFWRPKLASIGKSAAGKVGSL